MPPTKVCPQCKTTVPVKRHVNAVIMSFDPNEKQSVFQFAKDMKRMRAVESDSVKSARKDKLHEARERVSETREQTVHRPEQNRMCMATSTITCTAAPRVCHFSAFHFAQQGA